MAALRATAAATAILLAVAAAGCGVGPGDAEQGTATLTVTRDHGSEVILEATEEDPTASESVVRLLDREAEIETSYGGNFVDAIDGISGTIDGGRSEDWFFYVNGYWSAVGAGEATVHAGDRIWWDYRDWTDAYRVPAVVGSYPEPFVNGDEGRRLGVELDCTDAEHACEEVADRLADAGAEVEAPAAGERPADPDGTLRVLVGSWAELRDDPAARTLEGGPGESGVYAIPERCPGSGYALATLDDHAERTGLLTEAAWVAAVRDGEQQPTWVVSASRPDLVGDAAELLDEETLDHRYAVAAASTGEVTALPTAAGQAAAVGSCG